MLCVIVLDVLTIDKQKATLIPAIQKKHLLSDEKQQTDRENSTRRRRKTLQTLFENTTVIPFDWKDGFSCFYCDKSLTNQKELKKHAKSHSFTSEVLQKLRATTEVKLDMSEISCEICEGSFRNLNKITEHLVAKHGLKYDSRVNISFEQYKLVDFSCCVCQDKFQDFPQLQRHGKFAHPKITYSCNICFVEFSSRKDLEAHNEEKHFDSTKCYVCPSCQKIFTTKKGYKVHITKICVKVEPKTEIFADIEKRPNLKALRESIAGFLNMCSALPFKFFMQRFRCFYCSQDFVDFEPLRLHTVSEHTFCDPKSRLMKLIKGNCITIKVDITYLSCKICSETMANIGDMLHHLITKHNAKYDGSLIDIIQPYKLVKDNMACLFCDDVTFRYFSKLLEHMNELHSRNKIICSFCGMVFGKDPNYRSHLKRHHNPNSLKCNDCHLEFDNMSKLSNHRAKLHGEKTYKCPECFETFGTQYKRQKHLIDAHGSGHPCTYCGKLFTRNSFMKDHIRRTHLKEKNAECSVCKEKFFDNILLRIHMVKHVGERNFHCDICGKTFLWKKNLRGHMASHK